MNRLSCISAVLVLSACAGVTGSSRVAAKVQSFETGGRDSSALQPIAGARLVVHLPDGSSREVGATDASGWLEADVEGVPTDATVSVERDGFRSSSFKVEEVCSEWGGGVSGNLCRSFRVSAVLRKESGPVANR